MHWACASETDAYAEHTCQELMSALSISVRNWCVHCACASGTNVWTQHRPFKTCWAYASGTNVYPERTSQELMCLLSIRVRNWCAPSAYASVSNPYAQHRRKNSEFEKVPWNHAAHTRKELYWIVAELAYAPGNDAHTQHVHQKIKWCLAPPPPPN
jgi:hypothetical protein